MVFTSWAFVKFFLVVVAALRLLPTRTLRQLLLLIASCVFYAYWEPAYLLLLATPSVIDYVAAARIAASEDSRVRKGWLAFSVVTNLGLLGYFKYAGFFVENVSRLVGVEPIHLDILLPVGISFYTFKTLSYTIDVYRREIPACPSLWRYAMFVTYFPELVAGPIVRASVFLPQMGRSLRPSWTRAYAGLQLVLLGVTKKLVVADRLAPFVDAVFASPGAYSPATVASAVVAYSLQIYCDFSGYTDIAIGVSKVIGFDLPENFRMPYLATSIADFWRRWHMTLSAWLRDYLYIPLGGNRRGRARTYANLMVTMLLGGLWHGAGWTFVLWGALHGLGLVVHRLWRGESEPRPGRLGAVAGWLATYAFVCFAWVFFRAADFPTAVTILEKIAGLAPGGIVWVYSPLFLLLPLVAAAHAVGWLAERGRLGGPLVARRHRVSGVWVLVPLPGFMGAFLLTAWLLLVYLFASIDTSPFIYFQF